MPLRLREVTHALVACISLSAAAASDSLVTHAAPSTTDGDPASVGADGQLPAFDVLRTGAAFGAGENTPFPRKKAAGVVFGERFLYGDSREDGFFEVARSIDGHTLFVRIYTDDAIDSTTTFELKAAGPLPKGAVLQMVDGYTEKVTRNETHLGSATRVKSDGTIIKQFFEAWLAVPERQTIVRPTSNTSYPLISAFGPYDAAKARRAQWVAFVSKCKEAKGGPCVYYGPASKVCGRAEAAGEDVNLITSPAKCEP